MKTKIDNLTVLEKIQKELNTRDGLLSKTDDFSKRMSLQKGEFHVKDNDELLFTISCLLKTCVLALEGDANFSIEAINNANTKSNIVVSLEFIISILPRQQMVSLDEIIKIISESKHEN